MVGEAWRAPPPHCPTHDTPRAGSCPILQSWGRCLVSQCPQKGSWCHHVLTVSPCGRSSVCRGGGVTMFSGTVLVSPGSCSFSWWEKFESPQGVSQWSRGHSVHKVWPSIPKGAPGVFIRDQVTQEGDQVIQEGSWHLQGVS